MEASYIGSDFGVTLIESLLATHLKNMKHINEFKSQRNKGSTCVLFRANAMPLRPVPKRACIIWHYCTVIRNPKTSSSQIILGQLTVFKRACCQLSRIFWEY
jgi:hypothetical protein